VKGLQRLENVNHEKDFAFIVGDERYHCPSFVAEFLSPRVASRRSQDITIDEFIIETEDPDHHFGTLLSVGFGREVSFTEPALRFVRSVCRDLCNSELFEQTLKSKDGEVSESELKTRLEFLSGVNGSCDCDVSAVASHFCDFSVSDFDGLSPSVIEAILSDSGLVLQDEDSLFEVIHRRASTDLSYFGLLEFVRFEFLSDHCMKRAIEFISSSFGSFTFGIWSSLQTRLTLPVEPPSQPGRFSLPPIDSKIISATPEIFSACRGKICRLLYRGSRDGFQARAFHSRCDGHGNTVTLILSTNDCIFGGYTPLAWSSRDESVSDPSLKSFVFTIKNPHNLPPTILKQQQEGNAIHQYGQRGPVFGQGHTLSVCDQCHTSDGSYSNFGSTYANDAGIAKDQVLAGTRNFTVEEIEVFEVVHRN
jgi:hypothetical protein